MSRTRSRIAFVAPYAYPALAGTNGSKGPSFAYIGGAEMQQARLARVLAARGHDVWMVSADFGQPERVEVDGVTVERAYRPFDGLPGLRFFHPRWSGIVRALDRVSPDVVYQRTAGVLTGQAAMWARARGRRFVFACAHDFDTRKSSPALPNPRDRMFYRWGLTHADRVLAQSRLQVESLRTVYGIEAALVRNVVPLPEAPRPFDAGDAVVWLGTLKREKRPDWMLGAARALPHVRFVVAGGPPPPPMDDGDARAFAAEAKALPNVEVTGHVPPAGVPALLARAALFAHTSPAEGFPNTLLEAWSYGVPSLSVVDPDGAVSAGAGVIVRDAAEFTRTVDALWADVPRRRSLGERARGYVAERHAPDVVARDFLAAVDLGGSR